MRYACLMLVFMGFPGLVHAQSDMELILLPDIFYTEGFLKADYTPVGTADDKASDEDFEMSELSQTLRYNLKHTEARDIYLTVDTYWASIDNTSQFKESGKDLPEDLYDMSAGILFREEMDNGWTFGGTFRLGASSNKMFSTYDEAYIRSQMFLRIPHLKYTSWVIIANISTDGDFPIYPGLAYAFPISKRAYMVLGIPVIAAGGKITDKLSFTAFFIPFNSNVRVEYALTDRLRPYTGYTYRSRYFARAHREEEDDQIRMSDSRVFAGTTIKLSEVGSMDIRAGYAFDREFGEGDDYDDRNDNTIKIDDAAFASVGFQFNF